MEWVGRLKITASSKPTESAFNAARRKDKRLRAPWSKTLSLEQAKGQILSFMRQGLPFTTSCKKVSVPIPTATKWRKSDIDFKIAVLEFIYQKKTGKPPEQQVVVYLDRIVDKFKDEPLKARFLREYRTTRSRSLACDSIEISPLVFYSWCDPDDEENYDAAFAEEIKGEEIRVLLEIEDELLLKAASGVDLKTSQFVLERRLKGRYGKPLRPPQGIKDNTIELIRAQSEAVAIGILHDLQDTPRQSEDSRRLQGSGHPSKNLLSDGVDTGKRVHGEDRPVLAPKQDFINIKVDSSRKDN